MKPANLLTIGICFFALALLHSVNSTPATNSHLELQALIAVLRDTTYSRTEANRYYFDPSWFRNLQYVIDDYRHGLQLDFYSLSDAKCRTRRLEMESLPKLPGPLAPELKDLTEKERLTQEENTAKINTYFEGLVPYSGQKNRDYTHLNLSLTNAANNLKRTDFFGGPRILIINSDLIDHVQGGNEELLNEQMILLIRELAETGVHVFILSENTKPELLEALDGAAVWLSQPHDIFRYLKKILYPVS